MEIPTAALVGGPLAVVALVTAVVLRIRARRRRRLFVPGGGRFGRGGPAGVREPRKPLVPAGAGAAAIPLPD